MPLLTAAPYKSAIQRALTDMLKRNFKGGYPLERGLVAVMAANQRGTTCDFYVDAPGAFRMNALPEWAAIAAAATPGYLDELSRINQTPGVSIWADDKSVYVGTAGGQSMVEQDSAKVLDFISAIRFFQHRLDANKMRIPGNKSKMSAYGITSHIQYPWNAVGDQNKMSLLTAAWCGIYVHSKGQVLGVPFHAATLEQLYGMAKVGKTIYCTSIQSAPSTNWGPYDLDCEQGAPLASLTPIGNTASIRYEGYIFPAQWNSAPIYIMSTGASNVTATQEAITAYFANSPIVAKSWSDMGITLNTASTVGWSDVAALWPAQATFTTPYASGSSPEQLSPVRALPQISAYCGFESLVMRCPHNVIGHYGFDSVEGVEVKVLVMADVVQYMGVPLDWMARWAGELLKQGKIPEAKKSEIESVRDNNADTVVAIVSYPEPVMLEHDLVLNTALHSSYKKAREKACKTDDFTDQTFNEFHTYGTLNTLINGSRSTREFYALRYQGEYVEYTPKEGGHVSGTIIATVVSNLVTKVVISGTISGTYVTPSEDVSEAYTANYTLSGCTEAQLGAWLGVDIATLSAYRAEAKTEIDAIKEVFSASSGRSDPLAYDAHLLRFGGFPDYKVLVKSDVESARKLVMSSKGAVKIGPTVAKLAYESRSI